MSYETHFLYCSTCSPNFRTHLTTIERHLGWRVRRVFGVAKQPMLSQMRVNEDALVDTNQRHYVCDSCPESLVAGLPVVAVTKWQMRQRRAGTCQMPRRWETEYVKPIGRKEWRDLVEHFAKVKKRLEAAL